MRFETVDIQHKRLSPLVQVKSYCGGSEPSSSDNEALNPPYITGYIEAESGRIPVAATRLSARDKRETVKARISSFRMSYSVKPGLYAAGKPDKNSEVFVTANYKMSFDALRSSLDGVNAWIIVLDTAGINVWCAAGKGTFGTDELVRRITAVRLTVNVSHKRIIVPQLGAPGVSAAEVRRRSGFSVKYGPVRASDLKKYIESGYTCSEEMRRVRFNFIDRLILTPIELRQIMSKFHYFLIFVFIFFGLRPEGIIFSDAVFNGYPFMAGGLISVFAGAFFTPLFLPYIPFRSFAMKGWAAGMVMIASAVYFSGIFNYYSVFAVISGMIIFPVFSSYMAFQFTGASTYTSLSGVKKELKIAFPFYIAGAVLSFIFLILYKIYG